MDGEGLTMLTAKKALHLTSEPGGVWPWSFPGIRATHEAPHPALGSMSTTQVTKGKANGPAICLGVRMLPVVYPSAVQLPQKECIH